MADKTLFPRLRKLFAGSVVIRSSESGGKLKVADTDMIQAYGNLTTNFNRNQGLYGGFQSTAGKYNSDMATFGMQRQMLYREYEQMELDPMIASALNIVANECTVRDEFGDVLTIKTDNIKVKQILENLFKDILNVDFNLWAWIRSLAKYGDFFLKLEIAEKYGIVNVVPVSQYEIRREEGYDPKNPLLVRYIYEGNSAFRREFDNFEIGHFRLLTDTNYLPYGKSWIEPSRREWKRLTLMEDAMLIHRIMRAPEKRIFRIDVGNIPPKDHETYVRNIISKMKKTPFIDERTGEYNLRFNIQNITEDIFLPVRGSDSGTSIDSLPGLEYNAIEDIEYLRNKVLVGLSIPKSFLGYSDGFEDSKALANQSVVFAKAIERIQRTVESELTRLAILHLYVQGFKDEDLVSFELKLTNPSTIYEQEKISLWSEKANLTSTMKELNMFSEDFIYKNIWNMTEDEIANQRKLTIDDVKRTFRFEQIKSEGNDPFVTNQTFGTPHDLAIMNKSGFLGSSKKDEPITFKNTNFRYDWNSNGSTGNEENITDDPEYDVKYNKEKREPSPSKYGQDSHINGRDPLGSHELKVGYRNPRTRVSEEDLHAIGLKFKSKQIIKESLELSENKELQSDEMQENDTIIEDSGLLTENTNIIDDTTFLSEDNILDEKSI